jgi:hypothetical protein
LEIEFSLCTSIPGFTLSDIREKLSSREIDWFFSRLIKKFQDEANNIEGNQGYKLGGRTF